MNVAIYVRSAIDGEEGDVFIAYQIEMLRDWAQLRGWSGIEYVDRGSGSILNRPALQQLLADAKEGVFERVLVADWDRLSRSWVHLVYLQDLLLEYGIVILAKEAYNEQDRD